MSPGDASLTPPRCIQPLTVYSDRIREGGQGSNIFPGRGGVWGGWGGRARRGHCDDFWCFENIPRGCFTNVPYTCSNLDGIHRQ